MAANGIGLLLRIKSTISGKVIITFPKMVSNPNYIHMTPTPVEVVAQARLSGEHFASNLNSPPQGEGGIRIQNRGDEKNV